MTAQGIGAGGGALLGGPFGAILGSAVAPVLEAIIRRGNRRLAENVYRVLFEASEVAGMSPEELASLVEQEDRYLEISSSAVQAAMSTLNEQKVTALARALGDGLLDEAKLDMSWVVILALADLESPHIRALARFAQYPTDRELDAEFGDATAVNESPLRKERMALSSTLSPPIISALLRHGLVSQTAGYGLYVDGITDFGREVLRYLEQHAPPPSDSADGTAE